jgi:hypothetical protein
VELICGLPEISFELRKVFEMPRIHLASTSLVYVVEDRGSGKDFTQLHSVVLSLDHSDAATCTGITTGALVVTRLSEIPATMDARAAIW